jgi:predicted RNase H-like HicB family nuclease
MEPDIPAIIEQLDLRVYIEFDEDYQSYVARCIDTGASATGTTIEEAEWLIKEILENDFRIAIEQGTLRSLLHAEPSFDAKIRWYELKAASPESIRRIPLEVPASILRRGVQSELRIIGKIREGISAA